MNELFHSRVWLRSVAVFAILVLISGGSAFGQTPIDSLGRITVGDSRGKDFWMCFPQNAKSENGSVFTPKLFITADRETNGRITIPGIGFSKSFSVHATEVIAVDIDPVAQVFGSDAIQKLGVHVEAENDVAVFGLSTRQKSTDTYLAYPTNVLGTTYRAVGYYPLPNQDNAFVSQFDIVGTEDHTTVVISLNADTYGGHHNGETFSVEIQKGDVYQVQGSQLLGKKSDLTGTLVTSSKKVGFFIGHSCAQVPPEVSFCDQLLEMEPPVPSWGRQFFVGRFQDKEQYVMRVVANEDNTQVFVNNRLVAKLLAGEFYEDNHMVENALVTSSKPVLIAEYAQSSDADSIKVGDPFMLLITPTEQFLKYYRFATPIQGDWHHYINLVVPIDAIQSLKVDGIGVPDHYFHKIGFSKFAVAQYEIGYGPHTVICEKPIGLYSYGFGVGSDNYDSYGNDGGQLVQTVPLVADTLRPLLELVSENGESFLGLLARDDRLFDFGLAQVQVIDSSNFRSPVVIPKFDIGTPQLPLSFRIRDTAECAFMSLRLTDAAHNESYWVICRTRDEKSGRWKYTMTEGRDNICPACRSWTVQFISTPSFTISDVTFEKPSYLAGCGTFDKFSSRLSGGLQGLYIFPFNKQVLLAGGIGYANITGAAVAEHVGFVTDSILYGDTIGARKSKSIEDFTTEASLNYLTLNGGVYYYFIPEKIYLYAGLAAGFLVGSSYFERADLLFPATLEYVDGQLANQGRGTGTRSHTIAQGSLPFPTRFHIALELSPGVQFKLSQKISLLAGAYLNFPFFDAVKDLNWHLTSFGARIGLQYRN